VQFVPVADVAADGAVAGDAAASGVSAVARTGGIYVAGQATNIVTGHFTVGGAVVDATFSFPGALPDLAEDTEAKEILDKLATATGATGIGVGVLADNR